MERVPVGVAAPSYAAIEVVQKRWLVRFLRHPISMVRAVMTVLPMGG
jgi:hypothetical protein